MEQKQRYCGDCASYIPGGGYPNCIAKRAKKNIITKHEKTDLYVLGLSQNSSLIEKANGSMIVEK